MARRAVDVWNFCGGWAPERWPVYHALHRVPNWHAVIAALQVIREHHPHG